MLHSTPVQSIIEQAYDCVIEDDRWTAFMQSYAQAVGADSGIIYLKSRANPAGAPIASANFDTSSIGKYLAYYDKRSPLIAFYRNAPVGRVRALGDFAFSRNYRETEFFRDWVHPYQHYADMLGSHLIRDSQLYAWLALRRGEERGVYTPAEIATARRIAPHIARALKLRCRLDSERQRHRAVLETFQTVSFGILIVDEAAKVLMANSAAESTLSEGDGLHVIYGRLVCRKPHDTSVLHHALKVTGMTADLSVDRGDRRPLTLHLMPFHRSRRCADLFAPLHVAPSF